MRFLILASLFLLASTLHAQEKKGKPPAPHAQKPQAIKEKLGHTKKALLKAKEAGRHDEALRLVQELQKLQGMLKKQAPRAHPGAPTGHDSQAIKEKLGHIKKALLKAKEAGRHDEALRLAQEVEKLQGLLQKRTPPLPHRPAPRRDDRPAFEALIDRIGALRKEAFRAGLRGDNGHSKSLWTRADDLQRSLLQQLIEATPQRTGHPAPPPPKALPRTDRRERRPGDDLRREVEQLRRDVEELKRLLRQGSPPRAHPGDRPPLRR